MANLNGKIALVTGGSRGLGQGIALVLGEHGCTVYITGRSTKENSQHPEWPNATIDKTAQLVTEMGGKGIPIQCDHTDDDQVDGVYERIKEEKGYIDILVNVIWGRAVVALACDPNIISRTGQVLNVGNLSREYGFTDIDGTQPPPYQIEWTGKS